MGWYDCFLILINFVLHIFVYCNLPMYLMVEALLFITLIEFLCWLWQASQFVFFFGFFSHPYYWVAFILELIFEFHIPTWKKTISFFPSLKLQVLSLTERLHSVTAQFDKLRAIRFQDAISRAMPRRKFNRITNSSSADTSKSNNLELREPDQFQPEPLKVQQQLLDDETRALQVSRIVALSKVLLFCSMLFHSCF